MTEREPDEIIAEFLDGLPDTICNEVYIFVLFYAFSAEHPKEISGLFKKITERLLGKAGLARIGAVIRTASAIDFVLNRFVVVSRKNVTLIPKMARSADTPESLIPTLEEMRLRGPMSLRHAESALHRWETLRAGPLSHQSLMDFEDRSLASVRPRGAPL